MKQRAKIETSDPLDTNRTVLSSFVWPRRRCTARRFYRFCGRSGRPSCAASSACHKRPTLSRCFQLSDAPDGHIGGWIGGASTAAAVGLRQLAVSVCGGFRKPRRFGSGTVPVIYMTGKRQPRRSHRCAPIRVSRLSHKAVLCEVADRAARESFGFLTLPKPLVARTRWRATQRVFSFSRVRHSVDTAFQGDALGAEKFGGPPPF